MTAVDTDDNANHRIVTLIRTHGMLLMTFVMFSLGTVAIYKLIHSVNIHDVVLQFKSIPKQTVLIACLMTALGYTALIGYDWSALRYIGKKVPGGLLAMGSLTAYALSNTMGIAVLSGGAVRYRFYRGMGLDAGDIAVVSSFCALSFGMGVTLLGLAALAYHPHALASVMPLSAGTVRAGSTLIVLVSGALILWSSVSGHTFKIGRFKLGLPKPSILLAQLVFSVIDILFAAITLYILLPDSTMVAFSTFVAVFAAAAVISVLSHVPGGIGVFESIIITGIGASADQAPGVVAALLAYRMVYYIGPFILALCFLALFEALSTKLPTRTVSNTAIKSVLEEMRPVLVAGVATAVFMAGAVMVLNGLIPIPAAVLNEIQPLVPTGILELSNVVVGAVGASLVLLSNGLRQRIKAAFWIVLALLIVGTLSLIAQVLDFDLVIVVIILIAILWSCRSEFYRQSKLTTRVLSVEWVLLVLALLLSAGMLLLFAHEDTEYQHALWWNFAFDQNTPRALRLFGASVLAGLILILFLALRPARQHTAQSTEADPQILKAIVDAQDDPDANFVFTGDKSLLMSADNDAFIMYARQGRSFVALGEPVGPESKTHELIEAFIALADKENCRPVFYQVAAENLSTYIDYGFTLSKLGEEASVNLTEFSLEGPPRKRLRQSQNKSARDGLTFMWSDSPHSTELMSELKAISDGWLESKNAQEKSFSLGRFNEYYLQQFPMALVKHNGTTVAFANVMQTGRNQGATIDLMRHSEEAPSGTMDFLFVSLMLHLKELECQSFSLGMAPLIGLDKTHKKRLWDHLGLTVARFGGHFYNFEGLRAYKNKFDPTWEAQYMATWGGIDPLLVATDVNAIVSGGVIGAIRRSASKS